MEIIYIAILFFAFLSGESKNLKFSTFSLIPHSLLIATSVFLLGYYQKIPSLYLIAGVDFLVRAILMPVLLIIILKQRLERETKPLITHALSIALSVVLLSVIFNLVETLKIQKLPDVLSSFSCGFTLAIYGLFLLISKRDMVKMIIAFFIIENGIHFLIIALIPHLPKGIELALTFNFVVALFLFIYVTLRLNEILVFEEIRKFRESNIFYKSKE